MDDRYDGYSPENGGGVSDYGIDIQLSTWREFENENPRNG